MKHTQSSADKLEAATRDGDHWYDTGNLIIVCQGVAFRVWKCLLAETSSVFRDMFTQWRPDAGDLSDGCLVVTLDDSPKDWHELFSLLCPRGTSIMKPLSDPNANMALISAIIRLGHKYALEDLYDQAIGYLTTCYPTSFDAWTESCNSQWQPDPTHAIRAINLARLTNTTSVLPAAFYICATLGPDIARGLPLEDGSIEQLTPEDMHLLLDMKAHLLTENARTAFLLFMPPRDPPCTMDSFTNSLCLETWRRLLQQAGLSEPTVPPHAIASFCAVDSWVANVDCLPTFAPTPPPLGPTFHITSKGWYRPTRLCEQCRNYLGVRDRELRREVWRKLPEFLGLTIEGWDAA